MSPVTHSLLQLGTSSVPCHSLTPLEVQDAEGEGGRAARRVLSEKGMCWVGVDGRGRGGEGRGGEGEGRGGEGRRGSIYMFHVFVCTYPVSAIGIHLSYPHTCTCSTVGVLL